MDTAQRRLMIFARHIQAEAGPAPLHDEVPMMSEVAAESAPFNVSDMAKLLVCRIKLKVG